MSQKSRLLIVSGSFPDIPCGISPYVRRIAELLVARDEYDVGVLTSADPAVNETIADGYQVHPRIEKWSVGCARRICREIMQLEPDIVHLQNPTVKYSGWGSVTMSAVAPLLKQSAPSVRLVVMQHDIALSKPLWRWRYHPLFRWSDAIVVSNRRDYQAITHQGISPAKVYRAPMSSYIRLHSRDPMSTTQSRRRLGIPADAFCIVFFGFVLPERNVDVLIRALKLLRQGKRPIHGIILGGAHHEASAYYDRCRQLAKELCLEDHMTWTGFAGEDQIADGFAAADVFVSLLQRGADLRNTTIITAILAQLPIVTTRNPLHYTDPDLEKLGCFCVEPRDPQAVADAILRCRDNPPSAALLARGADLLEPDKTWRQHIDITCRAYRNQSPIEVF